MGLFWESRKIKEQKEEAMLSAILKQFETEINQGQDQKKSSKEDNSPTSTPDKPGKIENSLKKTASVEDFARFLSSKGLFNYTEWEDFQTKKNG